MTTAARAGAPPARSDADRALLLEAGAATAYEASGLSRARTLDLYGFRHLGIPAGWPGQEEE